jgi:hypothetical protein
LECHSQEMLVPQGYDLKASERIGHLGAVLSLRPFVSTQDVEVGVLRHLTCGINVKYPVSLCIPKKFQISFLIWKMVF